MLLFDPFSTLTLLLSFWSMVENVNILLKLMILRCWIILVDLTACGIASPQNRTHFLLGFGSGGSSAARIDSSKTFFRPLCEISNNKIITHLIFLTVVNCVSRILTYLRQCRAFNIFHCFQFFSQFFTHLCGDRFLLVFGQFFNCSCVISQINLSADQQERCFLTMMRYLRYPL